MQQLFGVQSRVFLLTFGFAAPYSTYGICSSRCRLLSKSLPGVLRVLVVAVACESLMGIGPFYYPKEGSIRSLAYWFCSIGGDYAAT